MFNDQLPTAFISDFIHWYNPDEDSVVFRPREKPWESGQSPLWKLERIGLQWDLTLGQHTMIDMSSRSASIIYQMFEALEDSKFIHITQNQSTSDIEIQLPRLQLDFHICPGEDQVWSRQYRNMVLDQNQDVGSLHGLTTKLVLRNASSVERMILIPEGLVKYTKLPKQHVRVDIEKGTVKKMHAYHLDSVLGRIVDSGHLQSKLLLCYLHALTSYCLPDTLTLRTGFESALSILESAAVRSFPVLTEDNVSLLNLIGRLSPKRTFYPPEISAMEQVCWDAALSPLSQHPRFNSAVQNIYRSVDRMQLYYPAEEDLERDSSDRVHPYLQERHVNQSSAFYVDGSGGECFTFRHDRVITREVFQEMAKGASEPSSLPRC